LESSSGNLALIYEERGPYIHDDFDPSVGSRRRIGVRNETDTTLEGVEVFIDSFIPQGADFLPIHLRRLHGEEQPFTLTPLQEVPIDVAFAAVIDAQYGDHLALQYDSRTAPNVIPINKAPYTLTLRAIARGSRPAVESFALSIDDDGRLLFAKGTP